MHGCLPWKVMKLPSPQPRLALVVLLALLLLVLFLLMRLDAAPAEDAVTTSRRRMDTTTAPTRRTALVFSAHHQQPTAATALCRAVLCLPVRTPSRHQVPACLRPRPSPANSPSSCRSSRIIIPKTTSTLATVLLFSGPTSLAQQTSSPWSVATCSRWLVSGTMAGPLVSWWTSVPTSGRHGVKHSAIAESPTHLDAAAISRQQSAVRSRHSRLFACACLSTGGRRLRAMAQLRQDQARTPVCKDGTSALVFSLPCCIMPYDTATAFAAFLLHLALLPIYTSRAVSADFHLFFHLRTSTTQRYISHLSSSRHSFKTL